MTIRRPVSDSTVDRKSNSSTPGICQPFLLRFKSPAAKNGEDHEIEVFRTKNTTDWFHDLRLGLPPKC